MHLKKRKRRQSSHILFTPKEKRLQSTTRAKREIYKTTRFSFRNLRIYLTPPGLAEIIINYCAMNLPLLSDMTVFVKKDVYEIFTIPACMPMLEVWQQQLKQSDYLIYINPVSQPRLCKYLFSPSSQQQASRKNSIRVFEPSSVFLISITGAKDNDRRAQFKVKSSPTCFTLNEHGYCECWCTVYQSQPVLYEYQGACFPFDARRTQLCFDGFSNWDGRGTRPTSTLTHPSTFAPTSTRIIWNSY